MRCKVIMFAGCIFAMGVLTACGASTTSDSMASVDEKNEENNVESRIEELRVRFQYYEESVMKPGCYSIDGVELCDAAVSTQDTDDIWEGYTEAELGFLNPDKMPNCIIDEMGNHWVLYNNIMYTYVNDYNLQYGDASQFKEYANVWCTMDSSNRKFLGDLEEYGRKCAQGGEK